MMTGLFNLIYIYACADKKNQIRLKKKIKHFLRIIFKFRHFQNFPDLHKPN